MDTQNEVRMCSRASMCRAFLFRHCERCIDIWVCRVVFLPRPSCWGGMWDRGIEPKFVRGWFGTCISFYGHLWYPLASRCETGLMTRLRVPFVVPMLNFWAVNFHHTTVDPHLQTHHSIVHLEGGWNLMLLGIYGGFPKMVVPQQPWAFLLKRFGGYHHLRKHPYDVGNSSDKNER